MSCGRCAIRRKIPTSLPHGPFRNTGRLTKGEIKYAKLLNNNIFNELLLRYISHALLKSSNFNVLNINEFRLLTYNKVPFVKRPLGDQYDPFHGRLTESKLYAAAKYLLYEPREGEGRAFAEKGMKMLTIVSLAGREANRKAGQARAAFLPFVGLMADLGLNRAANTIYTISPLLARRFLDEEYNPDKDYTENKYLANSWESVTARLYPLLTQEVLRMLAGASFTGRDLMRSEKPSTVYLRLPEADLLALSPITRLVLDSLIHELIATYDQAADAGEEDACRPVLFLIDEAGRTASLASLPDHLTTVRSRGISLIVAIQTLSQLNALYHDRAEDVINNCLSQLYYQPFS